MSQLQSALEAFHQSPNFWDWITLACLATTVLGFLIFLVWILGLPGRIAVSRNHPDAEAVYTMGWVGFLAIVPWIQALIWAFKPTDKIDIRRFPEEEQTAEREELHSLVAHAYGKKAAAALDAAPPPDTRAVPPAVDTPAETAPAGNADPAGSAAKPAPAAGNATPSDEPRT